MLSRPGKLNLLFKELGNIDIDISTFNNRKKLQKTVYILSKMGLKFNYPYNWYLHGPYSPTLTEDAYELSRNKAYYDDEIKKYHFKQNAQDIINKFKELFQDKMNDEEWLELIASLLFLQDNYRATGEKLKHILLQKKDKFREKQELVDEAIDFIKKITVQQNAAPDRYSAGAP